MADAFEISVEKRNEFGKAAARRMRKQRQIIPAVIYGAHQEPEHVIISSKEISHALENEAFYSHILTLNVAGNHEKAVLKKVQRDPASRQVIHVDFLRINPKEKLIMQIPLHFKGEDVAPGAKDEGGVISHAITEVEIRCLPSDLPEYIEVDVSALKLNEAIHLSDLALPNGVELMAFAHGHKEDHDQVVISIHVQHEEIEEEPEAVEAAAEGEVPSAGETTEASENAEPSEEKK